MNAKTQYKLSATDLETLLAMVRTGTLADAGNRLGVDGSTVFRSLQRIERGLGQTLFERSRTGYLATDMARALAQHAERIETEMETARACAQLTSEQVSGSLRITSTDTLMSHLVVPQLGRLHQLHPQLQLELHTGNELINLTRREADIALRATVKPPPHLVGKQLGIIRVAIFCSQQRKCENLDQVIKDNLPWIAPDDALPDHPSVKWRKRYFPKIRPLYSVSSINTVLEAVTADLGVGILPFFMTAGRTDLKQIGEPLEECDTQLWMLTHTESRHLRRVSTVFNYFAENLRLID